MKAFLFFGTTLAALYSALRWEWAGIIIAGLLAGGGAVMILISLRNHLTRPNYL